MATAVLFTARLDDGTIWNYTAPLAGDWSREETQSETVSDRAREIVSPDGSMIAYYVGLISYGRAVRGDPTVMGAWVAKVDRSEPRKLLDWPQAIRDRPIGQMTAAES